MPDDAIKEKLETIKSHALECDCYTSHLPRSRLAQLLQDMKWLIEILESKTELPKP